MKIRKEGMAWTGKIQRLSPIPNADFIVRAVVDCGLGGRWVGVVRKEDIADWFTPVVVFLPDAVVPETPELAFMEKNNWRVRPMRLRGCPSEVLIMPAAALGIDFVRFGIDVTESLGVLKYEKDIPVSLSGILKGDFPIFIPRTDEPDFQHVPKMRKALFEVQCTVSTKIDGSSQTFYYRDGVVGGCSRNRELCDTPTTAVWNIAHQYELPEKLPKIGNIAIQWEACGPGISHNPLRLTQVEPRVFDVWDIQNQEFMNYDDARGIVERLGMPFVPITFITYEGYSDDELLTLAEGEYESGVKREGIVIRPMQTMRVDDERLSFKVRNLLYEES